MKFPVRNFLVLLFFIVSSCSGPYYLKETHTSQTRIKQDSLKAVDSVIVKMIAPFKQKLDAQMNEVIAVNDVDLSKERPEGSLCNMAADAVLAYANKTYERPVDFCVLNYGGLRIPSISKGNITLGKIYELMPFDNQLEVVEIDGKTCKQLLDVVAKSGGWPVSGVRMNILQSLADSITFKGQLLDPNKTYTLVTSDYIVNGGDNITMLQNGKKRTPLNYKVRDAIIDYLRELKNNNQTVNTKKDGRITITQP